MTAMAVPTSTRSPRAKLHMVFAALAIAFLVAFALIQITPFVLTIANSFKCDAAVENKPMPFIPLPETVTCRDEAGKFISADEQINGIFFRPSVDGYRKILDSQLPRWLFNTAFLAVAVTILRLIFDSMAGYALARLRFPGNRALFFVVLGTMMIPGVVLLIPRFSAAQAVGLAQHLSGLHHRACG